MEKRVKKLKKFAAAMPQYYEELKELSDLETKLEKMQSNGVNQGQVQEFRQKVIWKREENVPSAVPGGPVSPDAMNLSSVDMYLQKHDLTATGDNVPAPYMSFESTGFPPELLREIYAAGFAFRTPIQAQTWPIALQNREIVAIAKTGSGKTLGYLIPAFMLLRHCNNNPQNGPTVVVLAPTRELATQIQDEAIKFGRSVRISCTCLYGGAPKGPQLKELERGADIVVATPGRLNDILEMRKKNSSVDLSGWRRSRCLHGC